MAALGVNPEEDSSVRSRRRVLADQTYRGKSVSDSFTSRSRTDAVDSADPPGRCAQPAPGIVDGLWTRAGAWTAAAVLKVTRELSAIKEYVLTKRCHPQQVRAVYAS